MTLATVIRWVARIWGGLLLAFVLFFVVAGLFGNEPGAEFRELQDMLAFIFFPVGTLAGLGIAYRHEGLGGLIATGSVIALFLLRPDLIAVPVFAFGIAPPGLLYIACWYFGDRDPIDQASRTR